jgi:RNA polymerase sigma-70 factor (ECF subfamily)
MIPGQALTDIRAVFERCQRRYPTIRLALEAFMARVETAVSALPGGDAPDTGAWLQAFAQLHHEDLFLAIACAAGDHIAWEYFADEYLPLLRRFAGRACRPAEAEDLAQELVTALMAGADAGHECRLTGYTGRGSLASWLRVTVARAAVDRFRKTRREVSLDEIEETGTTDREPFQPRARVEPVEDRLDAQWGPVLSRLLETELGSLEPRDRLLLVLYYVRGVPLKVIGRHFRVHEATASRWLDEVRRGIRKRIERELRRKHGLRPRELDGLWRRVADSDLAPLEKALAQSGE